MKYVFLIFLLSITKTVLIAQDWMGKPLVIDNSLFGEEVMAEKQIKSVKVVCSRPEIDEEGTILENVFVDTVYLARFNEKGRVLSETIHPLFKQKIIHLYQYDSKGQLTISEKIIPSLKK